MLFNISTFSVNNKILQDSKLENTMRLGLAGVNDLIAAEGKYHNKCLNAFKYDTQKTKKECEAIDLAMIFLVQELGYAASKKSNTPTVSCLGKILLTSSTDQRRYLSVIYLPQNNI
jgi:hypothetical protein